MLLSCVRCFLTIFSLIVTVPFNSVAFGQNTGSGSSVLHYGGNIPTESLSSQPSRKDSRVHNEQIEERPNIRTEEFYITTQQVSEHAGTKLPVKMLWLIDNSPSMDNDVEQVQVGIEGFISSLQDGHDLSVEVRFVSCEKVVRGGTVYGKTCLHKKYQKHPDISIVRQEIGSNNGLTIALSLLSKRPYFWKTYISRGNARSRPDIKCVRSFIDFLWKKENTWSSSSSSGCIEPPSSSRVAKKSGASRGSSLSNFFDSDHINVIVSVTDEDSELSDEDFVYFLKAQYGSTAFFRYYGYIDPDKDDGGYYQNLAKTLGGGIFNIKLEAGQEPSAYGTFFTELSKNIVVTSVVNRFNLKEKCYGVQKVVLLSEDEDTPLHPSLYSCNNKEFFINKDAIMSMAGKKVKVQYIDKQL